MQAHPGRARRPMKPEGADIPGSGACAQPPADAPGGSLRKTPPWH